MQIPNQPDAQSIRFEGACDACGEASLYSYLLLEFYERDTYNGEPVEYCGYYCFECGFSNAGERRVYE